MRRAIAPGIAVVFVVGMLGVVPAAATHCSPTSIATCSNPLTVVITEGVGNVCSKANVKDPVAYGTSCTYFGTDALWAQTKAVSSWNQSGYSNGSKFQGLFWPGVGPPAVGPYRLNVTSAVNAPNNLCVDSVAGPGCRADVEGKLTPGNQDGTGLLGLGAYCGSSKGSGSFKFTASNNSLINEGTLGWDQSAATILPVYGTVSKQNGTTLPSSARPSMRGFTSSRGVGGSGNCGVDAPTTGFQTEGIIITF